MMLYLLLFYSLVTVYGLIFAKSKILKAVGAGFGTGFTVMFSIAIVMILLDIPSGVLATDPGMLISILRVIANILALTGITLGITDEINLRTTKEINETN